jgi:hypothetical protein
MVLVWISKANFEQGTKGDINPLNSELNPTCQLLALLGAHNIFHVSELSVNS